MTAQAPADGPADRIGELIGDPERRARWRAFVLALHEAAAPGGPLDGWAFHGTAARRADAAAARGMRPSAAIADDGRGGWRWTEGCHFGTPKVAAFYAEDRIESAGVPDLELALVAARIEDLAAAGPFAVDGQTLDCPLFTRLDRPEEETMRLWAASAKDWPACWEVFGTLLVLGPVAAGRLTVLRGTDDLEDLLAALPSAPGRSR